MPFLRLGKRDKIHREIQPFSMAHELENLTTVADVGRVYKNRAEVATTCLGINNPLLALRRFDYCIIDEASQIHQA